MSTSILTLLPMTATAGAVETATVAGATAMQNAVATSATSSFAMASGQAQVEGDLAAEVARLHAEAGPLMTVGEQVEADIAAEVTLQRAEFAADGSFEAMRDATRLAFGSIEYLRLFTVPGIFECARRIYGARHL